MPTIANTVFSRDVNLVVFFSSVILISLFVKALTYLPDRYYFTFSQVVDSKNETQFLAGPELPSPSAFCRILAVENSPDGGTLRKLEIENTDQLVEACNVLQPNADVRYLEFPSDADVDGQPLNSAQLQQANTSIVDFLKSNQNVIAAAMWETNVPVRNNIAPLGDSEIENLLIGDGGFLVTNVLQFIANDQNAQIWDAYQKLLQTTELGQLEETRLEIFTSETENVRESTGWQKRARKYLDSRAAEELELIRKTIMGSDSFLFWPAVLLKILPALAGGFFIGLIWKDRAIFDAPIAAGFVAFLFCWPMIVLWDSVVAEEWRPYRNSFFALYIFYVLSYFFAARLGAMLALKLPNVSIPDVLANKVDWGKIATSAVGTVVTAGVSAVITWTFATQ